VNLSDTGGSALITKTPHLFAPLWTKRATDTADPLDKSHDTPVKLLTHYVW
jgi:hypothetical protein